MWAQVRVADTEDPSSDPETKLTAPEHRLEIADANETLAGHDKLANDEVSAPPPSPTSPLYINYLLTPSRPTPGRRTRQKQAKNRQIRLPNNHLLHDLRRPLNNPHRKLDSNRLHIFRHCYFDNCRLW